MAAIGIKVQCPRCGYEWIYKGRLGNATCPYCLGKVKIPARIPVIASR